MITEILSPEIEITWLPWAVAYFFFIGLSLTAVFLTLPATLFGRKNLLGVARVAMLVILTCAIVGPVALLADLHQPARFWHFYTNFTPWSWMSIGALFLPLYVIATFVYSWLFLRPGLLQNRSAQGLSGTVARVLCLGSWNGQKFLKPVAIITVLLALIIALYTGAEVAIVASRSLWSSYLIPVFFFTSALLGASSLSLLIAYFIGENNLTMNTLRRYCSWHALIALMVIATWLVMAIASDGMEARTLALLQDSAHWQKQFITLISLLVLAAMSIVGSSKFSLLFAASGLIFSWFSRWLIFIDGQTIPKYGAGFYTYNLPLGSDGLLGLLGMFGLWLFLAVVLYELLPWNIETESNA